MGSHSLSKNRHLYHKTFNLEITVDGVVIEASVHKSFTSHNVLLHEPYRVVAYGTNRVGMGAMNYEKYVKSEEYLDSEGLIRKAYLAYKRVIDKLHQLKAAFFLYRMTGGIGVSKQGNHEKEINARVREMRELSYPSETISHKHFERFWEDTRSSCSWYRGYETKYLLENFLFYADLDTFLNYFDMTVFWALLKDDTRRLNAYIEESLTDTDPIQIRQIHRQFNV